MKPDKHIDTELIEAYKSGNKEALATLVKRWHLLFCKKAFWIVKDADLSKDIAQETWQVIIDKIDTLKNTSSFSSWALRIVYTKAVDCVKQKNKTRIDLKHIVTEEAEEIIVDDNRIGIKKELLKAIQQLTKEKQDVIKLFYVESYSLKEISSILNITEGTVKSRLFQAREKLKTILKNRTEHR